MFFITLTLYATLYLNTISSIQEKVSETKSSSLFKNEQSKELEDIGLFIFKDKKSNRIIEISGNNNKRIKDSHLKLIGNLKEITDL